MRLGDVVLHPRYADNQMVYISWLLEDGTREGNGWLWKLTPSA